MEKDYIYAVTRIHNQEQYLLSHHDVERLLSAQNVLECIGILCEKGWGASDLPARDPDALLNSEQEKTWALIKELIGDLTPFAIFFQENDFHNLKAAIKLVYSGKDCQCVDTYFRRPGSIPPEIMLQAAQKHDFSVLPPALSEAGCRADAVLIRTGNGQACDMEIDFATLLAIDAAAKVTTSELLSAYATLRIDTANIKAAVRSCLMGKSRDFLTRVIAPAGSLDARALISAAATSLEAIYATLQTTQYADAVESLQTSIPAFERWCDDRMIENIRPQKAHYFTIEPLAAYLLARENEIAVVRLILTAKANRLDNGVIRERLRKMYV